MHRLISRASCVGCALFLFVVGALAGCVESEVSELDGRPVELGDLAEGADGTTATPDAGIVEDDLYRPDRILKVDLTLDPSDWERIRIEGRTLNDIYSGCADPAFEYSTAPATARIDGEVVGKLGLRKKGYLGSLSAVKPSLRLDFVEFDPRQRVRGRQDLTLNNSRSDGSLMRQCLAFRVFGAAGVPSPYCSFAHVTVNGQDLGLYVNVEPVKKALLKRYFNDAGGNLYEGNPGADFRSAYLSRFEKKTNRHDPDRSDLAQLSQVLEESANELLLENLGRLVDLDEFMRFWAVETLVGHWDGFAGDLNNFFAYHDPESGKFSFLPWGTDGTFSRLHPFLPPGQRPAATYAWARLQKRLYEYEPTRRIYRETLRKVLDTTWSEATLLAEIDRMAALLGTAARARESAALRSFVSTRRADIERELAADVPWTLGERVVRGCQAGVNSAVSGSFETTWTVGEPVQSAVDVPPPPTRAALTLQIDGKPQVFESVTVRAGRSKQTSGALGPPTLTLVGTIGDGRTVVIQIDLSASPPSSPRTVAFQGLETAGFVYMRSGAATSWLGYVGGGRIVFEQAGTEPGAPIVGHFEGLFLQSGASLPAPAAVAPAPVVPAPVVPAPVVPAPVVPAPVAPAPAAL